MSYQVLSSEQTTASGNDNETRALLYLMQCVSDSNRLDLFIIDFFNDLTACDKDVQSMWDVQSKSIKASPKQLGESLVTLFRNYASDFEFAECILF